MSHALTSIHFEQDLRAMKERDTVRQWHEWALWLNEHMPRDNLQEWLKWVLDSVPEERRLLTALALSVAHWHPAAQPRGGDGRTCALCVLYGSNCDLCVFNCNRPASWWQWAIPHDSLFAHKKTKAADAVYNDLKALYANEWRRVR
jgi:hypothetical protein